MKSHSKYTLKDLINYFLKLGTIGFGGPVALVGYMHRDLVENKKWITEEEYKEGLALTQLAPGPLAAQLAIYIGFIQYRYLGATLVGFVFILPSFIMVVVLGMIYQLYGGLSWIQAVFYGVGAAVIGIIIMSSYKLTVKSIGQFNWNSFKKNSFLWVLFITASLITFITQKEQIIAFIIAGFLYMLVKAPPKWLFNNTSSVFLMFQVSFWNFGNVKLMKLAIFFAEAGAFVFGSGLAIVPFLHSGVVIENQWLTEQQFIDAVAIAMITPGPVVITVGFIGYLIAGFTGATVAALATFLPCYIFTIALAPSFKKIAQNKSIKALVDGITASVVGALVGAVGVIASKTIVDMPTLAIALISIIALIYNKKLQEPYIIAIAALTGVIIKLIL